MSAEGAFHETSGVRFMAKLPRFGHGSDFAKLASSNQEEQTDYVVGVLAVSFFIIAIFIFWTALIFTCKCMGKHRVGFCAGRFHIYPNSDTNKGQQQSTKIPSHIWQLRCTFMIFGACMILLNFALAGPGLQSINYTSKSIRSLNRDLKDLITQGLLIMDQVKHVKWNIDAIDVDSILDVEGACPNLEKNTFISNKVLRSSIRGLDREFEQLKVYLEGSDFEGIRGHVDYLRDGTDAIDTAMTTVEKNDWIVRMFALVLSVFSAFMIFASCASLVGKSCYLPALQCMTEVFILPVFVIGIIGSWCATSALAFASVSNADFCTGNSVESGPAGTVMDIFEERGITSDDMIFVAFQYFQSGCETEDPISHIYKYEDDLQSGISSATKFMTKSEDIGIEEINEQCGADVSPIIEGIGLIKDNLGILLGALRSTFELASCYKMSPVYTQAFEGTACTDSSGSLTLMFLILIAMSFVGMIMIMLRAAIFPCKEVYLSSSLDDEEDEWEEYQAYLRYMAGFVTTWGGTNNAADDEKDGNETSSESTSNVHLGNSSSLSSNENIPGGEALDLQTPHKFGTFEDDEENPDINEEMMPLSPPDAGSKASSRLYTPQARQTLVGDCGDDDECLPLSPTTPSIHTNDIRSTRRFQTPDFLTPGTFRRWRRHDEEHLVIANGNEQELPQTPLMVSPSAEGSVNYFSSILSPMRTENEDSSTKID